MSLDGVLLPQQPESGFGYLHEAKALIDFLERQKAIKKKKAESDTQEGKTE